MSSLMSLIKYILLEESKTFDNKIFIKIDLSKDLYCPHYMALTDNGCVYSWGYNCDGQLGNATTKSCSTPTLINSLSEEFVIDICCGRRHSLVLTRNGDVFAFGDNIFGQCGNRSERDQLTPVKVNFSSKVTAISCGYWHSIALTKNSDVFGWGWNRYGQLGFKRATTQPIPLKLKKLKINQIDCGMYYTLMLTTDGDVYFCGKIKDCLSHRIPKKLYIHSNFNNITGEVNRGLYETLSQFDQYYIFEKYIVYKETNIFDLLESTTNDETINFNKQLMNKTLEYNYKRDFIEISTLGSGGYSTVFKSKSKIDLNMYAIKKISFELERSESVSKELEFLSQLKSEFIVKCYNSWIESNYYLDSKSGENNQNVNNLSSFNKTQLLHIQMELCSLTLKDAIDITIKDCKTPDNTLSLIGYYISSELLYEILECVNYLHTQNPAIIHRDLKPENILLTSFGNRFVKLSDFGLSTFHENEDQSHTKYIGTRNYKAPELSFNKHYTTKVDNFSIGIIIQELFQFQISDTNKNYLQVLKPKMNYLVKSVINLLSPIPDKRPNCDQLLSYNHMWCLNEKQIINKQFSQILRKFSKPKSIEENFVEYFLHKKYELNKINHKRGNNATFSKLLSVIKGNK